MGFNLDEYYLSNLYKVLEYPAEFYQYICLRKDSEVEEYSAAGNIASILSNKYSITVSQKGMELFCERAIPESILEKVVNDIRVRFNLPDLIVKFQEKTSLNNNPELYDNAALTWIKRKAGQILLDHKYISSSYLLDRDDNILFMPKEHPRSSITHFPVSGYGDLKYLGIHGINLRIRKNENNEFLMQADSQLVIRSRGTLYDRLKYELESNDVEISDVRQDIDLQNKLNNTFQYKVPALYTTYFPDESKGKYLNRLYLVKFDWNHTINDESIAFTTRQGETFTPAAYHTKMGRKIEDMNQPVVIAAYSRRELNTLKELDFNEIPSKNRFVPSLLMESTSPKRLRQTGASDLLLEAKLDSLTRHLMTWYLLYPLRTQSFIENNPTWLRGEQIKGINVIKTTKRQKQIQKNAFDRKYWFNNWFGDNQVAKWPNLTKLLIVSKKREEMKSEHWVIMSEFLKNYQKYVEDFVKAMKAPSVTIVHKTVDIVEENNEYLDVINDIVEIEKPDLLLFISNYENSPIYFDLKEKSFTSNLPIQVISLPRHTKKQKTDIKYVAQLTFIQDINKLGGIPFYLHTGTEYPSMVFMGLDRYRDTRGSEPSASAGVAFYTTDGKFLFSPQTTIFDKEEWDNIDIEPLLEKSIFHLKKIKPETKILLIVRHGPEQRGKKIEHRIASRIAKKHDLALIYLNLIERTGLRILSLKGDSVNSTITENEVSIDRFIDDSEEFRRLSRMVRKYRKGLRKLGVNVEHSLRPDPPVILKNFLDDPTKFILLTTQPTETQGSPRCIMYHIITNTTPYEDLPDVIGKVLASHCCIVWESRVTTLLPAPVHYADIVARFASRLGTKIPLLERPLFV